MRVLTLPKWVELKLASGQLVGRRRDWADVQDVIRTFKLSQDFARNIDPSQQPIFDQLWMESQSDIGDY
jgi:hypothetical protein